MNTSDNIESFSGSVFGGFSRRDVINYIERLSNEHEEELNARIKEIDVLKTKLAERDEEQRRLEAELEDAERRCSESLEAITLLHTENDKQRNIALSAQRECEHMRQKMDRLQFDIQDLDNMRKRISTLEAGEADLLDSKLRIANIEIEAHQRADQAYRDAVEKSEKQQADFRQAVAQAKSDFEGRKHAVSKHVASALSEFDAIRASLASLHDSFKADFEEAGALLAGNSGQESMDAAEPVKKIAEKSVAFVPIELPEVAGTDGAETPAVSLVPASAETQMAAETPQTSEESARDRTVLEVSDSSSDSAETRNAELRQTASAAAEPASQNVAVTEQGVTPITYEPAAYHPPSYDHGEDALPFDKYMV